MINVLIVDDQPIVRDGLRMLVQSMKKMNVVAVASNGQEGIEACLLYKPNVVLMDIKMPILNGVKATKKIIENQPEIKIIILTTFNDDEFIFEALSYGASGYLLKDAGAEKIEEAIQETYNGGAMIQPNIAQKVIHRFQQIQATVKPLDERLKLLTNRELDILKRIGEGKNNDEIACELFITKGTTKNHISNLLTKLDLRDRTQLAIFALKNDLI